MRVLVTGATGLLGARTALALRAAGHDVRVFQRGQAAIADGEGITEVRGDLSDPRAVGEALDGIDGVVHLAAKVDVVGAWVDYQRINVDGTRSLVEQAKSAGVQRFVFVSSPSVAHAGKAMIGVGAQPATPDLAGGHYARSKALAEQLVLQAGSESFAVTAIRPHLVWGPGDTQLIGRIVDRARLGRLVLVGSGAALFDTTYIDNAADAIAAAFERVTDPLVRGNAFVVTNGEPRPVVEILESICAAAGLPGPTRHVPFAAAATAGSAVDRVWSLSEQAGRSLGDPPLTRFLAEQLATAHWFDQRATRLALNWKPQVSLDEGFARLASSYRESSTGTGS